MDRYKVGGMSCAACQARVEKAVGKVPGVTGCSVNLLTNSMAVEGSAPASAVVEAVVRAGYTAEPVGGAGQSAEPAQGPDALEDRETPRLLRRFLISLGFLLILMYITMGHVMWSWPLPPFFEGNPVAAGLAEFLLCLVIMAINRRFFVSGFKALFHRSPNMDSLIALGSGAGVVYSVAVLFLMTASAAKGDVPGAMDYLHGLYFESSAMILTLITLGKTLESYSKGKTTGALRALMNLAPQTATVVRNGEERTVPVAEVKCGDVFVVRPGQAVPVDGVILEGEGALNESALTGESIPVDKKAGDEVYSATLNQSGFLRCRATRVGEDTTLAQIIRMVSDASMTKAPVARLADRISGVFVPAVMGIALVCGVVWLLMARPFSYALARAITVLVVSCPCALGLATPVAIMVGNGVGARRGILFKTAEALQETGNVQIVALDKTGTITRGEPSVTDVLPAGDGNEERLLRIAGALEANSEHPLARAVLSYVRQKEITMPDCSHFEALSGRGVKARIGGEECSGGNLEFIRTCAQVPGALQEKAEALASDGKTPLYFACGNEPLGVIAVADTIKEDSREAIRSFHRLGLEVVMLTGDHEATAQAIGREAGVDAIYAGVRPDGKAEIIQKLKSRGKVAMIGDGINDAPALTRADIGIAIGAGTDVAIDAADVVLMHSALSDAAAAIRLSRATYRNILENLFWALFYNSLLIPAAAGVYVGLGITMNPMFGAAAMGLSSFCVVMNALRLNLFHPENGKNDRPGKKRRAKETKEEASDGPVRLTLTVKGMMCGHCEATVQKALGELPGAEQVMADHQSGKVTMLVRGPVPDEKELRRVIQKAGYRLRRVSRE